MSNRPTRQAIKAARVAATVQGRPKPTARRNTRRRVGLEEAIRQFLTDGQARQFTPSTLKFYQARLGKFIQWASQQEIAYLDQISAALFRQYLLSLQERNLTSQTQLTEARAIRAWINFCVAEGYIAESPLEGVKMPRADKKQPQALSDDDVRALLAAMDDLRDRAMLLVLSDTGLRASEFCTLTVGDLNNLTGEVKIKRGKGRKDRTVFLGPRTRRELARYLAEREDLTPGSPLWINLSTSQRITYSGLRYILRKAAKRARVSGVSPHALRRTFAINSLRNGMPVHTLAHLMGHEDIDVLKHYLAIVDADLRAAAEAHGVVNHIFT